MTAKITKATILKIIKEQTAEIGQRRDALRAIISDVEGVCSDCDEAVESMEQAIEALSRNL
jgi:hypothetical protein